MHASFGDAILFTDRESLVGHALPPGVRWVEIDALRSIEAYSEFMIKGLAQRVHTSHVLVVQWDGYVLNPLAWREDFLTFDYIGAPWSHVPEPWSVGNGGFSLRSLNLLHALQSPDIVPSHPEDMCICVKYRPLLESRGIRFAPVEVARVFAVEDDVLGPEVFGFHGPYHLPALLEPQETCAFIESLDPSSLKAHYFGSLLRELTVRSRRDPSLRSAMEAFVHFIDRGVDQLRGSASLTPGALGVLKAMIRHGQFAAAGRLLAQRREALGKPWAEPKLWLRLRFKRAIAAFSIRGR